MGFAQKGITKWRRSVSKPAPLACFLLRPSSPKTSSICEEMMFNNSMKSTLTNPRVATVFPQKLAAAAATAALFHSTPVLDRRRRSSWVSRNNHARRSKKQNLLRDVSAYAEQLFYSWQSDFDPDDDQPFHRGPSWFRKQEWNDGSKRSRGYNLGGQSRGKRQFHFCEDDFEFETIFQSPFGGNQFFFYSFVEEEPLWRSQSGSADSYRNSWNRRYQSEEEYDSDNSGSDLATERLALGLSASGPLKLEDVKKAYHVCALKWHPDRHHGAAKDAAEEKFKLCGAAYQSLCDKLAVA